MNRMEMALQCAPQHGPPGLGDPEQAVRMMANMSPHLSDAKKPALAALITTAVVKTTHLMGVQALRLTQQCLSHDGAMQAKHLAATEREVRRVDKARRGVLLNKGSPGRPAE